MFDMLVDSHCHLNMLNLEAYDGSLSQLLDCSRQAGVSHILCVATDLANSHETCAIAEQYDFVSASVGLHPSEQLDYQLGVEELLSLAKHDQVIALGETGLDYYYNETGLDNMRERFRVHIRAAHQAQKPLIIHTRGAQEDTIRIMREEKADQVGGVMHCFTESWEMAEQALELGFYISFSGIVTFKNAQQVVEVVKQVPLENMLLETDAPYLTPVPYRGKPNQPHYVRYVAEKIAELKALPVETVVRQTGENFSRLFGVELL